MQFRKIARVIILIAGLAWLANYIIEKQGIDWEFFTTESVETLKQETSTARAHAQKSEDDYINMCCELSELMNKMSKLTSDGAAISLDVENGNGIKTMIDRMDAGLDEVAGRLDALEKEARRAKALDERVAKLTTSVNNMRKAIETKRKENEVLHQRIEEQARIIREQENVIADNRTTITRQSHEIDKLNSNLMITIFQSALDMESFADQCATLDIHGQKDKARVKSFRSKMYEKSLAILQQMPSNDFPLAGNRMGEVQSKIEML